MALIAIFLVTIAAGAYDFGQGWRSGLAVNEAARTAARVGSARGPALDADYSALSGAKAALRSSGKLDEVERVVIYKVVGTNNGDVPAACKTGSLSTCTVITGTKFREDWEQSAYTAVTDLNGCLTIAQSKGWCPKQRDNRAEAEEYFGVWIKIRHDYEFSLLGSGVDVQRSAVMRLEPKGIDLE